MVHVSYLIFAYNHSGFIEQALHGAFAQACEDMEIIVTDDASTDDTAAVIERVIAGYAGPHAVSFRRHPANLGLAAAVNAAVEAARGEVLVMAAGDDVSLPARSGVLAALFEDSRVQMAFSNAQAIDARGVATSLNYLETPFERTVATLKEPWSGLLGATIALRRSLFATFGPLDAGLVLEDRVLPLRAAMAGRVVYADAALILYRYHGGNAWAGIAEAATDTDRWAAHRIRRNGMMIAVCRNRLRDLATGRAIYPAQRVAIDAAADAARRFIAVATAENRLFGQATLADKLAILRQVLTRRIDGGGSLSAWVRKAFSPRRYLAAELRRQR